MTKIVFLSDLIKTSNLFPIVFFSLGKQFKLIIVKVNSEYSLV